MQLTNGVKNLLILNGLFWLATMLLAKYGIDLAIHFPGSAYFKPFQFVTSMFAHRDFGHLLGNMITLVFFGPFVEMMLGDKKFIGYYLLCGLGATAIYLISGYVLGSLYPMLGASGATSGIMIFFLIYFWDKEINLLFIPFPVKGWMLFIFFFGKDIYNIVMNNHTGIAHWAHMGGAIVGFLYVQIWRRI